MSMRQSSDLDGQDSGGFARRIRSEELHRHTACTTAAKCGERGRHGVSEAAYDCEAAVFLAIEFRAYSLSSLLLSRSMKVFPLHLEPLLPSVRRNRRYNIFPPPSTTLSVECMMFTPSAWRSTSLLLCASCVCPMSISLRICARGSPPSPAVRGVALQVYGRIAHSPHPLASRYPALQCEQQYEPPRPRASFEDTILRRSFLADPKPATQAHIRER